MNDINLALDLKKPDAFRHINPYDKVLENIEIPDSIDPNLDYTKFGFYVKDGVYETKEIVRGKEMVITLSNFTMKSTFHLLNGTNNTLRIICLQRNKKNQKYIVEVYSNEMKPESFETILKSKQCTFLGTAYQLKRIFAKMMDEETEAVILQYLGWNQEYQIYVFADSIFTSQNQLLKINQLGTIEIESDIESEKINYYLPSFGFANKNNEDFKTERLYKFRPGNADFKTWSSLFYRSFGPNGVIGMLYTIMSVYRDVIFAQVGFFPFLFLFGNAGTGKTSYTGKLLSLFGTDTIGTPLNNSSIVGLSRLVSQRSNSLFYYKEYTNETDTAAEDFILTTYDGAGRTTGLKSNDNKTKTTPVRSAIIFDGNNLPSQKSAILSRMILLNFESDKFTSEASIAFKQLTSYTEHGLGNVLIEILKLRPTFEDFFASKFHDVSRKIKETLNQLPERIINHTALLLTIVELLEKIVEFPFTYDEAKKIIIDSAEALNELLKDSSPESIFWQSFSYNLKKGQIIRYDETSPVSNKNVAHFRLKQDPEFQILQIKLAGFFPYYIRYCKDNNLNSLDMNSIRMILTSKSNKSFIPSNQKGRNKAYTDKNFGSCHQFRVDKTETGLEINDVEINI